MFRSCRIQVSCYCNNPICTHDRIDGKQGDVTLFHIASSVNASVWKVKQHAGYRVKAAEDVILILEAMKTEINVEAGEENIGRTIDSFANGVVEGAIVTPGQILVYLTSTSD
jgi:urea carboxylase